MEVYDFDYGWSRIRARIWKSGSVYIDMPSRIGFRDTICLEERGWRYTSTQDDCIDYIFHMWMKDNGMMAWANDMSRGIQYLDEPFNPDYPNADLLNDTAMKLYTISHKIRDYQKRNLPVHDVFELRKLYLTTALKTLGYDSIAAVGEPIDDSRGYLGLTKVVDSLEKYLDLSRLVFSPGKYGDYEQVKCRALETVTREQMIEYVKPVKDQIDEFVAFMQDKEDGLTAKRKVFPEYRTKMKEKGGEYSFDAYEEKVKAVAMLLLELNADLLTDEEREKFGIKPFEVKPEIEVEDRISSLIDSEEFNDACKFEDTYAYDESKELVRRLREISPDNISITREEVVKLLEDELKELEERNIASDTLAELWKKHEDFINSQETKEIKQRIESGFQGFNASGSSAPPKGTASAGRCNSEGVSYLYASLEEHTAIAEIRPFIRDSISVAVLQPARDLHLVNFDFEPTAVVNGRDFLFNDIQRDFSKINKTQDGDYLITQFIASLIEHLGYDGLCFRSSLVKDGTNYVIFNPNDCPAVSSKLVYLSEVNYVYGECK